MNIDYDQLSLDDQILLIKLYLIRMQYDWFRKAVIKAVDESIENTNSNDPYSLGDLLIHKLNEVFEEDSKFIDSLKRDDICGNMQK